MKAKSPADFITKPQRITLESFKARMLLGLQTIPYDPEIDVEQALTDYWHCPLRGFKHSLAIYKKACYLLFNSKNALHQISANDWDYEMIKSSLLWASILHELGDFFHLTQIEYGHWAIVLAENSFENEAKLGQLNPLTAMLYPYIYNASITNHPILYGDFCLDPIGDIFRLSHKIALSGAEQVRRLYAIHQSKNIPFFDRNINLKRRFAFDYDFSGLDTCSYCLYLFLLSPGDFFYPETISAYRHWETAKGKNSGKLGAWRMLKSIATEDEIIADRDWQDIEEIYLEFIRYFELDKSAEKWFKDY